jgi:hypothetical protein
MIVCSNLGPVIALSLGCWLLDHIFDRLGACSCRCLSPSSALSCSTPSWAPNAVTPISLVFETLGGSFGGVGSLACSLFSPVPIRAVVAGRLAVRVSRAARAGIRERDEDSIMTRQLQTRRCRRAWATVSWQREERRWRPMSAN